MSRRGMTLLELLIAVTLVSLLSTGMLFAIRAGLGAMEGTERRFTSNRRASGAQRILQQQFGAFIPARALCGQPAASGGEPQPFFQGEPGALRFVTGYSLLDGLRGTPQIAEIFVAPASGGEGVRLLLNEIPWRGPVGAGFFCSPPAPDPLTGISALGFTPPRQAPSSFVLADRLAYCRILYREPAMQGQPPREWLPKWIRTDAWPEAVRVEMASRDSDPARLAPLGVTALLGVTKYPGEPYVP
jgi:prepilin-type N-terminal cleavage/methylation domain-containing protein